jgi:hypothetical protein
MNREVKGYEIGSEVGFYYGCYLLWREMLKKDESILPSKCVIIQYSFSGLTYPCRSAKSIDSLGQKIEAYELVVCGN